MHLIIAGNIQNSIFTNCLAWI